MLRGDDLVGAHPGEEVVAGVELAHAAFTKANPEANVEARHAFNSAWAKLWAQQMSPEAATFLSGTSSQAPGKWRVNGVLANQPEFAQSYKCKVPGPMALPADQQIKVW